MSDLGKIRDWLTASAAFIEHSQPMPPGVDGSEWDWVRDGLRDRGATFAAAGLPLPASDLWRTDPVRAILEARDAVESLFAGPRR